MKSYDNNGKLVSEIDPLCHSIMRDSVDAADFCCESGLSFTGNSCHRLRYDTRITVVSLHQT